MNPTVEVFKRNRGSRQMQDSLLVHTGTAEVSAHAGRVNHAYHASQSTQLADHANTHKTRPFYYTQVYYDMVRRPGVG